MTRAIPRFDIDLLVLLSDLRREENKNYGRWDQRRREAHIKKLRRTRRKKWLEKHPPQLRPYDGNPRAALGLSIQEKILVHMLPGEWLSSVDIAKRAGLTQREVNIKIRQKLEPNVFVVRVRDPVDRSHKGRATVKGDQTRCLLNALTPLGCAVRADRLRVADLLGAPKTMPPPSWKIPEKFLESFGIDFSPFFEVPAHAGGANRHTLGERKRAAVGAWARRAQAVGIKPTDGPPDPQN